MNHRGNDYICADIHGHFDLLEQKLDSVNFDAAVDRIFSLGDLIDRGEDSARALVYLVQPWFYPILGNHEIMLMEAYEADRDEVYQRWYHWGGWWAQSLSREQLRPYYLALSRLPIAIELQLRSGKTVGLVHAELPDNASWKQVRKTLDKLPDGQFDVYDRSIVNMLWTKTQLDRLHNDTPVIEKVRDIDHVFHGHNIVHYVPVTIGNRTFMDLGSYETGELGFLHPESFCDIVC